MRISYFLAELSKISISHQVHTAAEQRSGMAKDARTKRGDAARGEDKMRAESERSKFNGPPRKIDSILEARETNERKSRIQNELHQPETVTAYDFSHCV